MKIALSTSVIALVFACSVLSLADDDAIHPTSAGPLTIDQAVSESLAKSPDIQRMRAAVGESVWRKYEALGTGFVPKISVTGIHFFAEKYVFANLAFDGAPLSFPELYPTTQLSIDASLPVFDGLSNVMQLQAASLTKDASEQELARAEFETSQQVRLAFYQALAAGQLAQVAETNVKTLEDHLKQVQVQRQGGAATNYDTLRVEVQLNEARADAIDAEDNVTLARKRLTQVMGYTDDTRPLQGELPVPDGSRVKTLDVTGIPESRTDIQALDLRAEAANKRKIASNVWMVPRISLMGEYEFYNDLDNSITSPTQYRGAYNVGVTLTWNIFDGGVALARSREAAYQQIQAEKVSDAAKLQIPYDFAYWKKRYLSNADHYQTRELDVGRSEESVRLAKEEERAGSRTSTETLDAELDLFRAKAGVVNAQLTAAEAQIRLELALGRAI